MRRLFCIRCGQPVRVREGVWKDDHFIEFTWIDPALFVGECCLQPKGQLELDGEREETPRYDPAKAAVPF